MATYRAMPKADGGDQAHASAGGFGNQGAQAGGAGGDGLGLAMP
ncbi:hypothetical protein [Streptomyces hygroscopicus]|nr:hypothetical protein [Streptomyces hygroscopicus]